MKKELVYKIESYFPRWFVISYRNFKPRWIFFICSIRYWLIKQRLRHKKAPLQVIFIGIMPSLWKYDKVYKLMEQDGAFVPLVLIAPIVNSGYNYMVDNLNEMKAFCDKMGYKSIMGFDEKNQQYKSVVSLRPDIVMYGNPYAGLIDKRFYITAVKHALPCYVHYAYANLKERWEVASLFHMRVWRHFVECKSNLETIKTLSPFAVSNRVVTGYPMYDVFAETTYSDNDWKLKDKALKRIIYAPHHTIEGRTGMMQYSTFLENGEFMLELAQRYKDKIQFVFKPHPWLKKALYQHPHWGKDKTDAYYEEWSNGENTMLVNGAYIDLFKSSDALIHDCSSFIMEYQYTGKPVMFLSKYANLKDLNETGQTAFTSQYLGECHDEIEHFIQKVVIDGIDSLKAERKDFFDRYLLPPNGYSVAENILNDIKSQLGKA